MAEQKKTSRGNTNANKGRAGSKSAKGESAFRLDNVKTKMPNVAASFASFDEGNAQVKGQKTPDGPASVGAPSADSKLGTGKRDSAADTGSAQKSMPPRTGSEQNTAGSRGTGSGQFGSGQPSDQPSTHGSSAPKLLLDRKADANGKGQALWPEASRPNARHLGARANLPGVVPRHQSGNAAPPSGHFNQAQSDPYLARRKVYLIALAVALAVGGGFWVAKHPDSLTLAANFSQNMLRKFGVLKAPLEEDKDEIPQVKKMLPTNESELDRAISTGSCANITHAGLSEVENQNLSILSRVRVADCFVAGGSYSDADRMFRPLRSRFQKMQEKSIVSEEVGAGLHEGFVLSVVSYLKTGRYADATKTISGRCRTWEPTPVCVAKLLVSQRLGNSDEVAFGYETISPNGAALVPGVRGFLNLVGAQVASFKGVPFIADERYGIALKSVSKDSATLLREIYETWGADLFRRRDGNGLTRLTNRAQQESSVIDNAVSWKFLLLRDFLDQQKGPQAMARFLSRSDVLYRSKQDFRFLTLIGKEAIEWNQGKKFSDVINDARNEMQNTLHADSKIISEFNIWRLRALIAENKSRETIREIDIHEHAYGPTNLSKHFRGIAYLADSQNPRAPMQAAREFKQAASLRLTWESQYGLAVSLLRAKDVPGAQAAVKTMASIQGGQIANMWYSLALAELMIAMRKPLEAINLLDGVKKLYPDSIKALEVRAIALRALGRLPEAQGAENRADEMLRKVRYWATTEGKSSPFGPYAFL